VYKSLNHLFGIGTSEEELSRLLIWARFLRLFLEVVAPCRHRSGQDQQHANAGSGCGIPLPGQVNDGPTQKEPEAETDENSAENLVPFHPKPSTYRDCSKRRGRLTYVIGELKPGKKVRLKDYGSGESRTLSTALGSVRQRQSS
jgi:hypothetical protein